MNKKESLLQQKAKADKKVAQLQNQQKILLNRRRDLERRERNHRLILRGLAVEGVFPFTVRMESEAVKAFLIALSRLPGAKEIAEKAQKTGAKG